MLSVSNRSKTYQEFRELVNLHGSAPYKLILKKYLDKGGIRISDESMVVAGSRSCWDCGKPLKKRRKYKIAAYCSKTHRMNDEKKNPKIACPRKSKYYRGRMVVFHVPQIPPSVDQFHLAVGTALYLMERNGWHVYEMYMTTDQHLQSNRLDVEPLVSLSSPPSSMLQDIVALWIERGMHPKDMICHSVHWRYKEEMDFLDFMLQLTGQKMTVNRPDRLEAVPWMLKHGVDLFHLSDDFIYLMAHTPQTLALLRMALENGLDINKLQMDNGRKVPRWFIILDTFQAW